MICLCLTCIDCIEEQKLVDTIYKGLDLEEWSNEEYYRHAGIMLFGNPKSKTHKYRNIKEENGSRWYLIPRWVSDNRAWVAAIREVNEIITNMNHSYFGGTKLLQK